MTSTVDMIPAADLGHTEDPLAGVRSLAGVRIEDVGQGDALTIVDDRGRRVFRIDYGGVQSSPFIGLTKGAKRREINKTLPVRKGLPIMLTHWDEDHWASAVPRSHAAWAGEWLAPRQWTSPSAVARSTQIRTLRCIPPAMEKGAICYVAANGDQLWWEKLKPFRRTAHREDCNRSGVAFSIVQAATGKVIFLPGDAPFHLPKHYARHAENGRTMRGLVAFHHGAGTHWAKKTHAFLKRWRDPAEIQTIVYSAGDPNRDRHPVEKNYLDAFPAAGFPYAQFKRTSTTRANPNLKTDILF